MVLKENGKVDQLVSIHKPEYDRKAELQAFDDTKAGVKGLVDSGVKILPSIFVNEDYMNDQKCSSGESKLTPPVIDLEGLDKLDTAARAKIVEEIGRASQEWGFFQIVNHGIPHAIMERMLDGVRAFHEMETELKKKYYTRDAMKKFVYNSSFDLFQSRFANWRDTIFFLMAPNPPDPEELPHVCRETTFEYTKHAQKLAMDLLRLLSEALRLKPNHLEEMHCAKGLFVIGNYYPACPQPDLTFGFTTHTDSGLLNLLMQGQIGGLQILHENKWVDVPSLPGALVVNIGDLLEIISNAKFKSVHHRVLANNVGPRMSVGFVLRTHLDDFSIYGPIKELLSAENPPIYRDVTVSELVARQFKKGASAIPLLSYFKLNKQDPAE